MRYLYHDITIIPFMPDGWNAICWRLSSDARQRRFPDEDLVLFAVSVYLLKQDVLRVSLSRIQRKLLDLSKNFTAH